jgi:polysaccharide pyruvyl transferase WcaK-like protein
MTVHGLVLMLRSKKFYIRPSFYTFDKEKLLTLSRIEAADMVVSVGAERINDNFIKTILFSLYMLWVIQRYDKFMVLFPQTIGPFHFKITRFLSAKVLNKCNVIFLRDRKSDNYIRELKIKEPYIINACDVALLQRTAPEDTARKILKEAGVPDDGSPLVGISPMRWSYVKARGKSRYDDYKSAIARVADELAQDKGVRVVFLPTNLPLHGCREDDVAVSREIMSLMKAKGKAYVIDKLCTPSELKSIMGLLEMCLVTRMHACIFATGILTPTFTINYQFKLYEYMKLMRLEKYTIDIDDVTYERLKEIAEQTWNDRDKIKKNLEEIVSYWKTNLTTETRRLTAIYQDTARELISGNKSKPA